MTDWDEIYGLVLGKKFKTALFEIKDPKDEMNDGVKKELLRLCIQLLAQTRLNLEEVKMHLKQISTGKLSSSEESMLLTVKAYISLATDEQEEGKELLESALDMDPSNAIARFSLGRQLIFSNQRKELAQPHLQKIADDFPQVPNAQLGLVTLYAEMENFGKAVSAAANVIKLKPVSLAAWLGLTVSTLASTPFSGRLALLICMIAILIPYFGPILLATWVFITILSIIGLRRISLRLPAYMLVGTIPLVAIFLFRGIILGGFFP